MINLSPEGLRHSDKFLQGWSKQPFPALSSSEHCTTAAEIVLTSPLKGGIVDSCAGNKALEKVHASDLWLSQAGPGVLVLLTDKLDPDSGSELVEVEKNRLELRAELEQRFYFTSGDLK